jgi:hypothetical protein
MPFVLTRDDARRLIQGMSEKAVHLRRFSNVQFRR